MSQLERTGNSHFTPPPHTLKKDQRNQSKVTSAALISAKFSFAPAPNRSPPANSYN